MPDVSIAEEKVKDISYDPKGNELEVRDFLSKRIEELKTFRSAKLDGNSKSIEDLYREVDQEYQPHRLEFSSRKQLESHEEDGLRSRLVEVSSKDAWRSDSVNPDLFVKVNTALSILIDQNPEAVFMASSSKYEKNTALAYGNWKNSWEVSGAKQQLKNFVVNQFKYGTAFLRTYPKKLEMQKRVRTEYYADQPDKDKYEEKTIIKCNDIYRESLNPKRVWMSESARVGDYNTLGDWYFEKDYSWDSFQQEFGDYKNIKFVKKGMHETEELSDNEASKHQDSVTVGFYENDRKDIYAIYIPSAKIVLYHSPLPNDDGMLSLTWAPLYLRSDECALGIGLWEIIQNDSVMYDRFSNMTMDQLTLSIYKMFFYKGTNVLGENGELNVSPGKGEQVADPNNMKFLEVPGPGQDSWRGLQFLQDRKDFNSGVSSQLAAKFTGKTLGQDIQAKEAGLERLKTPLDYLLDALAQEAYICISWQQQTLSTPEILEYTDPENLMAALKEFGLNDEQIQAYQQELSTQNPQSELLFNGEPDEEGNQRKFANVYKESSYNLEKDSSGELIENDKAKFYRFGIDLPTKMIHWRGVVRVKPQSVLAPSKDLTRRMKLDFYNLVFPSIEKMVAAPQFIPFLLPPIKQIVKIYEENLTDWVDEKKLMAMYEATTQPKEPPPPEPPKLSFSIKFETLMPDVQAQVLQKYAGVEIAPPMATKPEGMEGMGELFVDKAQGQPQAEQELFIDKPQPQEGLQPLVPRGSLIGAQSTEGAIQGQNNIE